MQHALSGTLGNVFVVMIALCSACSAKEYAADFGSSDTPNVVGAVAVELASALPHCGLSRRGAVFYVQSEAQLYYCDGWRYRRLPVPRASGAHGLCAVRPASSDACPNGGVEIATGTDRDRDGVLDPPEVSAVERACNGADGSSCSVTTDSQGVKTIECTDGTSAVIDDGASGMDGVSWIVSVEAAPLTACPGGGSTISAGPDADRDGVIDEVDSTQTICNGDPGAAGPPGPSGASTVLRLTRFDMHDECPAGGVLAQAGRDANDNGLLDDLEVESSEPICDGEDALLERISVIEPGALCEFGGERRERGLDSDGNGVLDDPEVLSNLSVLSCFVPENNVAGAVLELDGAIVRAGDLESPAPRLVRYTLDFGPAGVDTDLLSPAARTALTAPITPQSVRIAYAIDLLGACCGAELLELNAEIDYLSAAGERTDLRAEIQQRAAAVNVVSANIPFPVTPEYADNLWNAVLARSLAAQENLAATAAVDKGLIVVFVSGAADAQILENAYQGLDDMLRADTVVVLVVTEGNDADF